MTTICIMSDLRPSKYPGDGTAIKDINTVVSNAPYAIDYFIFNGDQDSISEAKRIYGLTNAKNIPYFYVVGNHELENGKDLPAIIAMEKPVTVNPGPTGTEKTTYSFDVGNFHVLICDCYWTGSGSSRSSTGYIPQALMNWIDSDLQASSKPFKIFVVHEPLYPRNRHVGSSLDANKSNRDQLQKVLENNNVNVACVSHTHYGSLFKQGTVWQADSGVYGTHKSASDGKSSAIFLYTIDSDMVVGLMQNGTISKQQIITGSTSESIPTVYKWKCSGAPNYTCTQTTETTGQLYDTEAECQAACHVAPVLKWRCSGAPNYTCVQTAETTGTLYDTQTECQAACNTDLRNTWGIGELSLYTEYMIMAKYPDHDSISAYGAYEKVIKDSAIISKGAAFDRAIVEVLTHKDPKVTGSIDIVYYLNLNANELINITVPDTPIDGKYVVTGVTYSQGINGTFRQTIQMENYSS